MLHEDLFRSLRRFPYLLSVLTSSITFLLIRFIVIHPLPIAIIGIIQFEKKLRKRFSFLLSSVLYLILHLPYLEERYQVLLRIYVMFMAARLAIFINIKHIALEDIFLLHPNHSYPKELNFCPFFIVMYSGYHTDFLSFFNSNVLPFRIHEGEDEHNNDADDECEHERR